LPSLPSRGPVHYTTSGSKRFELHFGFDLGCYTFQSDSPDRGWVNDLEHRCHTGKSDDPDGHSASAPGGQGCAADPGAAGTHRPAEAQAAAPGAACPTGTAAQLPPAGWGSAKVWLNVVYSEPGEMKLHLDIAAPDLLGPRPAVVMFPGGVPVPDRRQNLHPAMQFFLRHGYVAAAVEYRGPGVGKFPAPVDDAKNAVRFLRANAARYRIDPDRVGAWGMSLGGGMALMLAVTGDDFGASGRGPLGRFSSRVQAVVDRYGPADLATMPQDFSTRLYMVMSLDTADPNSPAARRASPQSHVSRTAAPVLAIHCRNDEIVPFSQSERFCAAMRKAGAVAELREIRCGGHCAEMAGETAADRAVNDECRQAELAWFDKYLKKRD
jgi:acetyl esterase/lipase